MRSVASLHVRRFRLAAAVVAVCAAGAILIHSIAGLSGRTDAGQASAVRTFICSQTDRPFQYELREGELLPVRSPHTQRRTGYPAEWCNWTLDGRIAKNGTPVLLNSLRNGSEPTFCPDCRRLVTAMNPPANLAHRPPPTEDQWKARQGSVSINGGGR